MNLNETDWMLSKAHHDELIQIAAKERLAREAYQTKSNRQDRGSQTANGLTLLFKRLGRFLQSSLDPRNAFCLPNAAAYPNKDSGDAKLCC